MINDSTQEEARHPVYACRFRASLFLPALDTAYWMLRGPLCNLRRANSERAVGRSLLAPRFPLACPRVILHAVRASQRRRRSYKVEPSSAPVDTNTHVSDAARTRAFISNASEKGSESRFFFFLPIIFQISIFLIAFIDLEILFHNKWQCKINL